MRVERLTDEHAGLYFRCLEDWSDEPVEGLPRKETWYEKMKGRGLAVQLALDDEGVIGGMIQYVPIEESFVDGHDLTFILCVWVHGHEKGRGNFQKRGMGKALLAAAEEDARASGAKGMAAWGLALPFWMKASWFKKHGYRKADRDGIALLVWKPFADDAEPPRWFKYKQKPELTPGKVTVTSLTSGWCMAQNLVHERARRAAAAFGDKVVFRKIDTSERAVVSRWGYSDALFIEGRNIQKGPPLTYEKIKKQIAKRVSKL